MMQREYHELSALRAEDTNLLYEGLNTFHVHLDKTVSALRFDVAEVERRGGRERKRNTKRGRDTFLII